MEISASKATGAPLDALQESPQHLRLLGFVPLVCSSAASCQGTVLGTAWSHLKQSFKSIFFSWDVFAISSVMSNLDLSALTPLTCWVCF